MMDWHKLLSDKRLGKESNELEHDRTAFQKDVDRVIFSSAFRRLQDKTQVFPLAQNDYVRTRLTHSLEVSSVGRSLGTLVGKHIVSGYGLVHLSPEDFGSIVAASCLSHDIGNPPFGHFGEEAIRSFFVKRSIGQSICTKVNDEQRLDLLNFEGNAQGFRILTKLQNPDVSGGMQLTYATLGAFTKYPCTQKNRDTTCIANKKNGLLSDDVTYFSKIANHLGLIAYNEQKWARHPLVFLMEAADDICYAIIDIEDAYQIRQIDFQTAYDLLYPLADGNINHAALKQMQSNSDRLSYLRAKAIGRLVHQAVEVFMDNEKQLLSGHYHHAISQDIAANTELSLLTHYAANHIYNCPTVVEIEMAGYRILGDLLEMFCTAVEEVADATYSAQKASAFSEMLINLLPTRFIGTNRQLSPCCYQRTLKVIDYVSGMTDSYAVSLYQKLTGIKVR